MRILFVGDASNFHNTLAVALRNMGHEVVVASDGSRWMDTVRDIDLYRRDGTLGTLRYAVDVTCALCRFRNFDVVHLVNPIFLQLKPAKLRYVFDYLRRNNRYLFLSALANDYNYVKMCYDGSTFRYSDYLVGDKPSAFMLSEERVNAENWLKPFMQRYTDYIVPKFDGIVACLYEYYMAYRNIAPDRLAYAGIPIDTDSLTPRYIDDVPDKVRFFIGIQSRRKFVKGSERLFAAVKRVHERHPDKCEICAVENVPYKDYVAMMRSSHVILDQLYSYTPATNALIAMAQGLVAVSGAEPEYYDFIGEKELHPIFNVTPYDDDAIAETLEQIVLSRRELPRLSRQSREFVVKHNDYRVVARRHLDFWQKIIDETE